MPLRIAVIHELTPGGHAPYEINVVKTAGGFARLGCGVTLFCRPPRTDPDPAKLRAALVAAAQDYGEPALRWEVLPHDHPATTASDPEQQSKLFGRWAAAGARAIAADLVYARHFYGGRAAAFESLPTALETHAPVGEDNPLLQKCLDQTHDRSFPIRSIVTINRVLADDYAARGADVARIHVIPDGVDLDMFSPPTHRRTHTPPFERAAAAHAVYTGNLYDWKGIPAVLDAAARLPHITFHLVGGEDDDITRLRARVAALTLPNVLVHGRVPYRDVPRWLCAADVLLLPTGRGDRSCLWTSPVKLGEYLATRIPVVAARIPGLESWVGEPAVRWFTPDDGADLARAIEAALAESVAHRRDRSEAAAALAHRFSYANRARSILATLR